MRTKLLSFLLISASVSLMANEMITNGDFLNVTSIPTVTSDNVAASPNGQWSYLVKGTSKGSADVVDVDDGHGNVAKFINEATGSWFNQMLMQNVAGPLPSKIHVVKFDLRGEPLSAANSTVQLYLITGSGKYLLKEGFDMTATPGASGARYDMTATKEWVSYEYEYDCAKYCSDVNSPRSVESNGGVYTISSTTAQDLSSFKLAINAKGAGTYFLDNVKVYTKTSGVIADQEATAHTVYSRDGQLIVDGFEGIVRVFTTAGVMAHTQQVASNSQISLAAGLYLVELQSAQGVLAQKVLVK